jgi:glycosyltransferase involved in cell wall biosynthesis
MRIASVAPAFSRPHEDAGSASFRPHADVGFPSIRSEAPASGGYLYDARVAAELRALGHTVDEIFVSEAALFDAAALATRLGTYDAVLEDELAFGVHTPVNALLKAAGKPTKRVAVVHVPAAILDPSGATLDAERAFLRSVDAAIFVSATTRDDTEALLGKHTPAFVARPGRDHFPDVMARPDGAFHVVAVGHVHPHKASLDLAHALRTFSELAKDTWRATIAGDDTIDAAYTAAVKSALGRAAAHVTFAGRVAPPDIATLLGSAHAFLTSARYESYGIAAAEALACGVPVVGCARGGFREIVRDRETGLLAEPGEPGELARALGSLAADSTLRADLAKRAREAAAALPTWRTTANEVARVLTRT